MKRISFSIAFCVLGLLSFSQTKVAVDTISRGNLSLILYNDKTWQYIEIQSDATPVKTDTADIMSKNWVTNSVYAQQPDYARTKDTFIVDFGSGKYSFPAKGKIGSRFGMLKGKMHAGIDIEISSGDSVVSAFDGIVRFSGWNSSGYGNAVVVRHYNGLETLYAHLGEIKCKVGQMVLAGELIGFGGNSAHNNILFETRLKDNAFDPELIFKVQTGTLLADKIPIYQSNFDHMKYVNNSEYHYVKSGDTLSGIARKYKVSVKQICKLNGITEKTILSIGKRLRLR